MKKRLHMLVLQNWKYLLSTSILSVIASSAVCVFRGVDIRESILISGIFVFSFIPGFFIPTAVIGFQIKNPACPEKALRYFCNVCFYSSFCVGMLCLFVCPVYAVFAEDAYAALLNGAPCILGASIGSARMMKKLDDVSKHNESKIK